MKIEIIVVDDEVRLAEQYSQKIYNETKIRTFHTADPYEAIEIVKNNPVKIAVLDQKMPRMSGTELYKELSKYDPLIKAIMLTGEADASEVGDALKLGFRDYIHKSNIANLQSRIFYYYAEYLSDLSFKYKEQEPISIFKIEKTSFLKKRIVDFELLSVEILAEDYVFPHSWQTIVQINAGEKKTYTDRFEITDRFIIENEESESIKTKLGLSASDILTFNSNIEHTINERYKTQIFSEGKESVEVVKEYQLKQEPQNLSEKYVISRHFQRAKVYRKIAVVVKCVCNCCKMQNCISFLTYQLTTNVATRQFDYYNDSTSKIIDTGIGYSLNG